MSSSVMHVKAKTNTEAAMQLQPQKLTFKNFLFLHQQALYLSWERLIQTPFTTFLTILVIAISLALPGLLFLFIKDVKTLGQHLDSGTQITLYLRSGTSEQNVNALLNNLKRDPRIKSMRYISPEEGLNEFAKQANLGDLLAELSVNPIPPVIVIEPQIKYQDARQEEQIKSDLTKLPNIEHVQMDLLWVERLQALIHMANQAIYAFAGLLSIAVILVIGNTLRLMIEKHHQEIEVMKLVGATNRYVLRPFIYAGALCGFWGSLLALLLMSAILLTLNAPLQHLLLLYQLPPIIENFSILYVLEILAIGTVLGILSAQFSVRKHLFQIRPEI